MKDAIIFGGGMAGCMLADKLLAYGKEIAIVDNPARSRCSRVAAGLINPIAGSRLNLAWMAETFIPFAESYYREVEERYDQKIFHERDLARLFANDAERENWEQKKQDVKYRQWIDTLENTGIGSIPISGGKEGFAVRKAGYVDTPTLLSCLRSNLEKNTEFFEEDFEYDDISITENHVEWSGLKAKIAFFCEGHFATQNPWFSGYPFKPAKGIIGRITTDIDFSNTIIIKRYFLIPRHDATLYVGATYNWNDIVDQPDEEGIAELENFLRQHLGSKWNWDAIDAGVRPATAGGKPIIGKHSQSERVVAFNGFGSKGCMQIPYLADLLVKHIWSDHDLLRDASLSRFASKSPESRWRAVEVARERVLQVVKEGDIVCDATCGNGHDTVWLAKAVGKGGKVYAIDIQTDAIEATRARLEKENLNHRVTFLGRGHENLTSFIPIKDQGNIAAIVFNLGYLPGGDKSIFTQKKTTLAALEASLLTLKEGGILSLVLYYGHKGGSEEAKEVERWRHSLDRDRFKTEHIKNPVREGTSPSVITIKRVI